MYSHQHRSRKGGAAKGTGRFLITVTVIGSSGPIRFLVNEGDLVVSVIATALRCYAREGRLPVLGSHCDDFLLFSAGSDALNGNDTISANGSRNFLLCKKQQLLSPLPAPDRVEKSDNARSPVLSRKWGGGSWVSWINRSFSFKIASH